MTVRSLPPAMRANFHNLYLDVFWYGVLAGSTLAFIMIYATRLGATAFQISLLTAGPAVANLLFSLPAGQWMGNRALIPVTFWSAAFQRFGYLLLIPLPWLFGDQLQIWGIVLLTLIFSIPGTVLAISFNSLFAEVVPAEWRAEVVGKRNAIIAISLTATTLLSGQLLDWLIFPLNYAIVFGLGALGAALSTYYLSKLRCFDSQPVPAERAVEPEKFETGNVTIAEAQLAENADHLDTVGKPTTHAKGKARSTRAGRLGEWLHLDLMRSSFGPFMFTYLLFYTFQYLGIPLFPLVQVNELKLSDGMISLGSSLFYLTMLLVSLRIIDISARLGHKRTLAFGATTYGIYPLLLGLANGPALYWVASFFGGGAWGISNAGLTNRLMEKVPEDQRPAGMAVHNLVLNLGILVGSLAAPLLMDRVGLMPAVLVVAALRFLAGGIFWLWG